MEKTRHPRHRLLERIGHERSCTCGAPEPLSSQRSAPAALAELAAPGEVDALPWT